MAKGAPRNAAAALLAGQQQQADDYKPPKSGVKAGLREGETRITCIFTDEQSQLLHDWAKTTGRTFREVCLAMADRYIDEVIFMATDDGVRLKRGDKEPPERYVSIYEAEDAEDKFARYF